MALELLQNRMGAHSASREGRAGISLLFLLPSFPLISCICCSLQGKDEEVSVGNSCDKLGISLNGNDSGTGGGNGGSGGGLLGFGGLSSLSLLRSNVSTSNLMGV